MKEIEIKGENIDITKIMEQIREKIKKKREQGYYTDEEIEELSRIKLQNLADEAEIDAELLNFLLSPSHNWNIMADYRITTHRKGIKGKLIILLKKIIRPFVRLYTDFIVNRQAQLNQYYVHILHNLVMELTRLQISHRSLRNRVVELEKELNFYKRREHQVEKLIENKFEED